MVSSLVNSPTSSVESSPNPTREKTRVCHDETIPIRRILAQVSDSDSDSGSEQEPTSGPGTYYVSPTNPEKRRMLKIPSPRLARLTLKGPPIRFKPSIPGYGEGIRKTIRVSASSTDKHGFLAPRPHAQRRILGGPSRTGGMQGAIPVSLFGVPTLTTMDQEVAAIPVSLFGLPKRTTRDQEVEVRSLQGKPLRLYETIQDSQQPHDESQQPYEEEQQHQSFEKSPSIEYGGENVDGEEEEHTPPPLVGHDCLSPPMIYRRLRAPVNENSSSEESDDEEEARFIRETEAIAEVVSEIGGSSISNHDLDSPVATLEENRVMVDPSPKGFRDHDKVLLPNKKDKCIAARKDHVISENLKKKKMKEIFTYPCCDNCCLRTFGLAEVMRERTYYFSLSREEKNIFLRGCLRGNIQGNRSYIVNGRTFCREGFKKLFSVGNTRIQRVSDNLLTRLSNDTFCKDKSSTTLGLLAWLNKFFATNVESLPNKDIFHLPDNWTKAEVYDAYQSEIMLREEEGTTYSWFCRMWNAEFSRVRIPRRSRFSTCAPCSEFKALRDKAVTIQDKSK